MLAILVGIHIGYRSGIPVANMTNVHMATYLRHKQIIYAYLDIPIGHITLHLCLGFTSHSLNGCIRGDRTRPTTTPTPIWRNTYQGGNLPSRPMDCQRRKCEGGVRSYGEAIPSLSGTAGGTILGRCRSAWNRSRRGGAGDRCHQQSLHRQSFQSLDERVTQDICSELFDALDPRSRDVFDHLVGRPGAEPLVPIVRVRPERIRLVPGRPRRQVRRHVIV
jgi:hypothetical protein